MNTIRIYSAIALMNAVAVILVVAVGSSMRTADTPAIGRSGQGSVIGSTIVPSPTAALKKRIIRVIRTVPADVVSDVRSTPQSVTAPVEQPVSAASVPTVAPVQQPDPRCLITIDGSTYDVTSFRTIHSGGDVFRCGSDMSKVFWSQHGQNMLNQMARYRV